MTGNVTREYPELCTAEEIIALSKFATVESAERAQRIFDATKDSRKEDRDTFWTFYCALANIYDAGRIQGIREERMRRRA